MKSPLEWIGCVLSIVAALLEFMVMVFTVILIIILNTMAALLQAISAR